MGVSVQRGRLRLVCAALVAVAGLGCTVVPGAPDAARVALAPSGTLRVAVYPGSPTSLVREAPPDQMRGVSVDIGRALALQLGVPSNVMVYPRLAEALAALQRGGADFTITNATAERAQVVDFAPPLVELELGVLVRAGSRVDSVERMDQPGSVVGVSQGSSSERVLGRSLKSAKLRSFPSLNAARAALQAGEIDAFATNKAILFELGEGLPGARVLDGRWGSEHLAPAIPKGRDAGLPFLRAFTDQVRRNGELDRAVSRAGLRGTMPAGQ